MSCDIFFTLHGYFSLTNEEQEERKRQNTKTKQGDASTYIVVTPNPREFCVRVRSRENECLLEKTTHAYT